VAGARATLGVRCVHGRDLRGLGGLTGASGSSWVPPGGVDVESVAAIVSKGSAVQIFSDGGYDGECGAAASVVVTYTYDGDEWVPEVRGHKGVFIEGAHSAFHAELCATGLALQLATLVGQKCSTIQMHDVTMRQRTRLY